MASLFIRYGNGVHTEAHAAAHRACVAQPGREKRVPGAAQASFENRPGGCRRSAHPAHARPRAARKDLCISVMVVPADTRLQ